jgi:hypothetical protein
VNNTVDIACGLWISLVDNPSKWGARRSNPIYKSPGQRGVDNLYTGYTQGGCGKKGVWITFSNICSVGQKPWYPWV